MLAQMRILWQSLYAATKQFFEDEVMMRGAALAFYAALSLAPLMLLFVVVTGLLIDPRTQQQMIDALQETLGTEAAAAVEMVLDHARLHRGAGIVSFIISIGMILIGATAVFVQLQWTLNRIWGVELKTHVVWSFLVKRLRSLAIMLVLGVVLLGSLTLTATLTAVVPEIKGFWTIMDWVLTVAIFALLFAGMFRLLPDVNMPWRPIWVGAIITAVLFAIGRWAIGIYLGASTFASAYGAAGSLIALLLWVYYSSLIFFFGAELTQAYAKRTGQRGQPNAFAQPTPKPQHG